jgi:acetamidase/formamidase
VFGSGHNINEAAQDGFLRAAKLLGMTVEEVRNRVTITGAVEIARLPGMVQVSIQAPLRSLERIGLAELAITQYGLKF